MFHLEMFLVSANRDNARVGYSSLFFFSLHLSLQSSPPVHGFGAREFQQNFEITVLSPWGIGMAHRGRPIDRQPIKRYYFQRDKLSDMDKILYHNMYYFISK